MKPEQEIYVNELIATGNRKQSLEKAGYSLTSTPENYRAVREELADRQRAMMSKFLDNAEEMKENMLNLARNSKSEAVKFQATKDILDRAGLNPVNKNQTESAKYVSIDSRVTREALERYNKEVINTIEIEKG